MEYGPIEVGLSGGQEYLTPYQTTIVFNPNSVFETAVSMLVAKAQPIISTGDNFEEIMKSCEHPSPSIVIFDKLNDEDTTTIFSNGFQSIIVISNDDSVKSADSRVTIISIDEIYDHLIFDNTTLSMFILDLILTDVFPQYKSNFDEITPTDAKCFMSVISDNVVDIIMRLLANNYKAFDRIRSMIADARTCISIQEQLATIIANKGVLYDLSGVSIYAVQTNVLINDVIDAIKKLSPDVKFTIALIYYFEAQKINDTAYCGWNVTVASMGDSNAKEFLLGFSEHSSGDNNIAKVWMPILDAKKILPFIY